MIVGRELLCRFVMMVCLFLGSCVKLSAQQERIDSMKSLLPHKTEAERITILYGLAYEYVDFNDSLGVVYGKQAFDCARRFGDSLGMVKAGRIRATAFRRLEELDSAIAQAMTILSIAKRNDYNKEVKQLLRGMALAYTYKATYDSGLYYNLELLRVTEQTHDSIERSMAFTNIGLIHYKLANFEKALHYYNQAVVAAHRRLPVNRFHIANTFLNMSLCYSHRKDFFKAREFLKKGVDYYGSEGSAVFEMESLQVTGLYYFAKGDLDSAEVYYRRSYSVARKLGNKRFQLIVLTGLVDIYLTRGQLPLAIEHLSEAESAMRGMALKVELAEMYLRFRSYSKRAGDTKGLIFYQKKYIQVNDSIHSEASKNNLMKIESEYLERTNNAKITEQEQLLALQDEVIERQNMLNVLVGIMAVLLLMLLYVLYRSNRQRRLVSRFLEQKVRERTRALELSYAQLRQTADAKDALMAKTMRTTRQHLVTLSGLCVVGLREKKRPVTEQCLRQLSSKVDYILLALEKIANTKLNHKVQYGL